MILVKAILFPYGYGYNRKTIASQAIICEPHLFNNKLNLGGYTTHFLNSDETGMVDTQNNWSKEDIARIGIEENSQVFNYPRQMGIKNLMFRTLLELVGKNNIEYIKSWLAKQEETDEKEIYATI